MIDDLPEHLVAKRSGGSSHALDTEGDREAVCTVCSCRVTIGSDGVEFGHARHGRGDFYGRCPHRPESVDPSGPQTETSGAAADASNDLVRDEDGQWRRAAADGGQVDE